ncbi:hypothetical protein [Nocardia asiatica]|uniref:hypothetical protein n=1 Tax=Nocardia asiatica TaxID=209252 RepID=UPI0024538B17|nr:hypothetical protein [Nocardia asiatica]
MSTDNARIPLDFNNSRAPLPPGQRRVRVPAAEVMRQRRAGGAYEDLTRIDLAAEVDRLNGREPVPENHPET